ncbi:MAG: lytic transglycosylase domain-containing protein [Myxococcota bacterium]|nr:lytic transglycosylase domain-containing protein [Myxococcota bacterium]
MKSSLISGILTVAFVLGSAIVLINLSIQRFCHGNPHALSARHLPEKVYALSRLSLHSVLRPLEEHEKLDIQNLVKDRANQLGVPTKLAVKIAQIESGFRSKVISSTGAMGVMQLMPKTAAQYKVGDPFNPIENIDGGLRYLRYLLRRYQGDWVRAAAAYNAGPGRVRKHGRLTGLPKETQKYIRHIKKIAQSQPQRRETSKKAHRTHRPSHE